MNNDVRVTDTVRERPNHLMPTDGGSNEIELTIDSSPEARSVDNGSCNLMHIT